MKELEVGPIPWLSDPQEARGAAVSSIRDGAVAEVLGEIDAWTGPQAGRTFELWLVEVFAALGYQVIHTGRTGDKGADLVMSKEGIRWVVQSKHSSSGAAGPDKVAEAFAARMQYEAQRALAVTNREFTRGAKERADVCHVELWDGRRLREELVGAARVPEAPPLQPEADQPSLLVHGLAPAAEMEPESRADPSPLKRLLKAGGWRTGVVVILAALSWVGVESLLVGVAGLALTCLVIGWRHGRGSAGPLWRASALGLIVASSGRLHLPDLLTTLSLLGLAVDAALAALRPWNAGAQIEEA